MNDKLHALCVRMYSVGLAAYVLMFILSILFYKERTIFLDSAYNLFHILNSNYFAIQIFRFGDCVTQLLPVLGAKAGLPLNPILQLYSVSFVFFYFTIYVICGIVLKRYDFALIVLFINILITTHTFYSMLSQLPQAMAIYVLIMAIVSKRQSVTIGYRTWIFVTLSISVVAFFHPLMIFVVFFSVSYFLADSRSIVEKRVMVNIALIYFGISTLKWLFFKTPYETHSISGLKNFVTLFPDYLQIYSNAHFVYNCVREYYWLPILAFFILATYFKNRSWNKLMLFVCFFLGYLALVNISYPTRQTPEFYIENLYSPLVLFVAIPFVFDVLPNLTMRFSGIAFVILIVVSAIFRFIRVAPVYSARINYERTILGKYGQKKVVLKATTADTTVLLMTWGTPYEFLLLSESEKHLPASIIIDSRPLDRNWVEWMNKSLVVNWNLFPYKDLNRRYFNFTDTFSHYELVNNR